MESGKRAIRFCVDSGLYCIRRWNGQHAFWTYDDVYSAPMSEDTRAVMGRLLLAAYDAKGAWVEYPHG